MVGQQLPRNGLESWINDDQIITPWLINRKVNSNPRHCVAVTFQRDYSG